VSVSTATQHHPIIDGFPIPTSEPVVHSTVVVTCHFFHTREHATTTTTNNHYHYYSLKESSTRAAHVHHTPRSNKKEQKIEDAIQQTRRLQVWLKHTIHNVAQPQATFD
jgi:hypothetical protein